MCVCVSEYVYLLCETMCSLVVFTEADSMCVSSFTRCRAAGLVCELDLKHPTYATSVPAHKQLPFQQSYEEFGMSQAARTRPYIQY